MVLALVEQEPNYAALARLKLTEMQLLPEVVTIITVKYCQDEVTKSSDAFIFRCKRLMDNRSII